MKKLDLSKEPYMAEERFISVSSTKSVTYIYPRILKDNSLLEYNMGEHSLHLFDEYFSLKNTLSHHIEELNECFFEEEEKIIRNTIHDLSEKITSTKAQINESIAPFSWEMYKNASMYSHEIDHYVKDDYVLILKYKKEDPDE